MALVIGTTPLEQPISYNIDRINGSQYQRTWIGPVGLINALAASEQTIAESVRVDVSGATATLRAVYGRAIDGSEEVPVETQELDTESLSQSIFLNSTFQALPVGIIDGIRRLHEDPPEATASKTSYQLSIELLQQAVNLTDSTKWDLARRAFDLLRNGTESFELHSFVLTRTRTVSRQYSQKVSLADLDKIFTTQQLVIVTGNPVLFDVPSLALTADEQFKNLMAGWRKKVARVHDVANGTRQVLEVWQLAKWSLDLYAAKV